MRNRVKKIDHLRFPSTRKLSFFHDYFDPYTRSNSSQNPSPINFTVYSISSNLEIAGIDRKKKQKSRVARKKTIAISYLYRGIKTTKTFTVSLPVSILPDAGAAAELVDSGTSANFPRVGDVSEFKSPVINTEKRLSARGR